MGRSGRKELRAWNVILVRFGPGYRREGLEKAADAGCEAQLCRYTARECGRG
jgi:hypothetical protein